MNGFVDADIGRCCGVHEIDITDQHRGQPDLAVQYGNQFRHLGHLHLGRHAQADSAADDHGDNQGGIGGDGITEYGCQHGDGHAEDAVDIAPASGFLMAQSTECEYEQYGRTDIGRCDESF
jgi:hypothetical protein